MDFSLSSDVLTLERSITAFARKQVWAPPPVGTRAAPPGDARRHGERFDHAGWDACARFGVPGMSIEEAYGGLGQGLLACAVGLRALARECPRSGLLFVLCSHIGAALAIQRFGDEAQRADHLPDLADGARIAGVPLVHASSERALGTPVRAEASGQGFTLDGAIPMVCPSAVGDVFLIVAHAAGPGTRPGDGADAPREPARTAFLVPHDTPGLTIDEPAKTRGLADAPVARLSLERAWLPASAVLGRVHEGGDVLAASLAHVICLVLACQVGRMQEQLETCVAHARTRRQFGRPIGSFQAISHVLADMKTRADVGSLLVERLAWKLDRGEPALLEAAMAKTAVTEGYIQSSRAAIQVHGGTAIMRATDIERDLADALVAHVYLGASETPRDIIAHFLMGLEPLDL